MLRGPRRSRLRGSSAEERIDVAAVIARALGEAEPNAEPNAEPDAVPIVARVASQPAEASAREPAMIAGAADAERVAAAGVLPSVTLSPIEVALDAAPAAHPSVPVSEAEMVVGGDAMAPTELVECAPAAQVARSRDLAVVAECDVARVPELAPSSAAEPAVDAAGATVRVPMSAPSADDALVAALLTMSNSVIYDLRAALGVGQWDEVVVELPCGEAPVVTVHVGGAWRRWRPSSHTSGTLELIRVQLHDVDPGVGYDIVVRPQEMIICRWPHRAWDARDPEPVDLIEQPPDDPGIDKPKSTRLPRLRYRS